MMGGFHGPGGARDSILEPKESIQAWEIKMQWMKMLVGKPQKKNSFYVVAICKNSRWHEGFLEFTLPNLHTHKKKIGLIDTQQKGILVKPEWSLNPPVWLHLFSGKSLTYPEKETVEGPEIESPTALASYNVSTEYLKNHFRVFQGRCRFLGVCSFEIWRNELSSHRIPCMVYLHHFTPLKTHLKIPLGKGETSTNHAFLGFQPLVFGGVPTNSPLKKVVHLM